MQKPFFFWQQQHWKFVISALSRLHRVLKARCVPCRDEVEQVQLSSTHIYATVRLNLPCCESVMSWTGYWNGLFYKGEPKGSTFARAV